MSGGPPWAPSTRRRPASPEFAGSVEGAARGGERVGGDYGTLRTDYSARTFRRSHRPHQDSMRRLALMDGSVSALKGAARGGERAGGDYGTLRTD